MWDDLTFAWRRLRHSPGYAVVAILTLAVAVGANTAILSIADGVLFRPLPYQDPDRVFLLQQVNRTTGRRATMIRAGEIATIGLHSRLSDVGLYDRGPVVLEDTPDGVASIETLAVNPAYLRVLGVRPVVGRIFADSDQADAGRVAVLSYAAWRTRFGGAPSVVGRSIHFRESSFDIVGVLPESFYFPTYAAFAGQPEIVTVMPPPDPGEPGGFIHPIARLQGNVTREQAQAELDALFPQGAGETTGAAGYRPFLEEIRTSINLAGVPIARFLVAAAGLVLLLGCANLANMLLVRGRRGERETAIRTALGASALRVVRPVLLEAVLIGVAGSLVAVAATALTFDWLLDQVPRSAYGNIPVGVDGRILAMGLVLGITGGLVFAVVPAWRASRLDVLALLQNRRSGRASSRRRAGWPMVVTQVALAVVLVFGAVMATRAFLSVIATPLGFEPDGLAYVSVFPAGATPEQREAFYVQAVDALRTQPGIEAVGATGYLPLGATGDEGIRLPNGDRSPVTISHALPGFLDAARLPVVRGRLLTWDDVRTAPDAAVISESAAALLFPDGDAIGRIVDNGSGRLSRIVGVVSDVRWGPTAEARPTVYAIPGPATRLLALVVRTSDLSDAGLSRLRRTVSALAPTVPVDASRWRDRLDSSLSVVNPRFQTLVLSSFAAIALALTALGIFGVVAFVVATRSREMGIRIAVGAEPRSLVRLMVRQALVPVAGGLAAGLLATRWLAGFAEAQLYDVNTSDPVTLAGATITVVCAALVAAWLPARRASRVDPVVALRAE